MVPGRCDSWEVVSVVELVIDGRVVATYGKGPGDDESDVRPRLERTAVAQDDFEAAMDSYFDGDLEPLCDLENPEGCDSCQ